MAERSDGFIESDEMIRRKQSRSSQGVFFLSSLTCVLTLSPGMRLWEWKSQIWSDGERKVFNSLLTNEEKQARSSLLTVKSDGIISGINSVQVSLFINSIVFCNIVIADWFIGYFACSIIGFRTRTVLSAGKYSAAAWAACSADRVIYTTMLNIESSRVQNDLLHFRCRSGL